MPNRQAAANAFLHRASETSCNDLLNHPDDDFGLVERNPNLGFGVIIFATFFEFGFLLACMVFAEPVLHVLAWSEVLIGNLLAAAAMAIVFWRRHPRLVILP